MADPKAYLRRMGMQFGVKTTQIDHRFRVSLSEDDRETLDETREAMAMGMATGCALYEIPRTTRQTALLYSHDAGRYRKSLAWFEGLVSALEPNTIVEMGCGAALTTGYLLHRFPTLTAHAVEAHGNLAAVARDQVDGEVFEGNYLVMAPKVSAELVVCDFGFDFADFSPSMKPHSTAEHRGFQYCPGCMEDLVPQMHNLISSWKGWMAPGGAIAVTGRFSNVGAISAAIEAAGNCGLAVEEDLSTTFRCHTHNGLERFPAMVFKEGSAAREALESAAIVYGS